MKTYEKLGIFSEAFSLAGEPDDVRFARVGANTGNLVFFRAIRKLFGPDFLRPYDGLHYSEEKLRGYDAFLTTDLIWIRQNQVYPSTEKILDAIGDRPLIPVSVGLQCGSFDPEFRLHPQTLRLLQRMEERCVLGVRGEYTAQILSDRGLRNLQVIGCPSVFFREEYNFLPLPEGEPAAVCNFKTFWGKLAPAEWKLLEYFRAKDLPFLEQTCQPVGELQNGEPARYEPWLEKRRKLFFSPEEWDAFLQGFVFSMGMRFHGNIIAMQNGLRALTVVSDSRTRELTSYFHLPVLELSQFDPEKSLRAYAELADPSGFLQAYPQRKQALLEFAEKNHLPIHLS